MELENTELEQLDVEYKIYDITVWNIIQINLMLHKGNMRENWLSSWKETYLPL